MHQQTRRDFVKLLGAGAVVTAAGSRVRGSQVSPAPAKGRIIGANDRINVGFVGCGGRMHTHITTCRADKDKADVQAIAVNDIWEKRKQMARERAGVDDKAVHHDYRELSRVRTSTSSSSARPITGTSSTRWPPSRTGKDVYLEKPMTYTVDEARKIAEP